MTDSVFADLIPIQFPHQFHATIHLDTIAGGCPADSKVAEAWLKTKLADKDDLIREQVAEIMLERELPLDAATELVEANRHLVGFRRDPEHGLYIEGRQIKAAIKEAGSIATNEGRLPNRFGGKNADKNYRKGWKSWAPEHVFVLEDRVYLGMTEPSGIAQSFPRGRFGTGIQYTEYAEDVKLDFTVITDHDFTRDEWAAIWLTAERNGLGASRSQGYGTYTVVRWDPLS